VLNWQGLLVTGQGFKAKRFGSGLLSLTFLVLFWVFLIQTIGREKQRFGSDLSPVLARRKLKLKHYLIQTFLYFEFIFIYLCIYLNNLLTYFQWVSLFEKIVFCVLKKSLDQLGKACALSKYGLCA